VLKGTDNQFLQRLAVINSAMLCGIEEGPRQSHSGSHNGIISLSFRHVL
jgi:hypothetical protein